MNSIYRRKKIFKRLFYWLLLVPILLLSVLFLIIYIKQDDIIQSQLDTMNKGHKGLLKIGDTHLAPFENFPDLSFKIDDVRIYETKDDQAKAILDVKDIYIGFNIWDILKGNYDVHSLLIEDGFFNIILHEDGTNNLQNAMATAEGANDNEELKIHLQTIRLEKLDIHKFDESTNIDVETYIYFADGGFKTGEGLINAHIDTDFNLNIFNNGDTTYIYDKHFEFHTDVHINEKTGMVVFDPSGITMEHGDFEIEGSLDTKNDMAIDLKVSGTKPNFDMFIAFAPHELIPVLERYKNAGKIYFNAEIKGPTAHGLTPHIDAKFGAHEAFLENTEKAKIVNDMGFEGHFTNGAKRDLSTMEFSLTGMTAKLEKGKFLGAVFVKNFEKPDIKMELDADFDVEFLAGFLNLDDIEDASGNIEMHMKFQDVIDIDNPELALKDINQAYFMEIIVDNLKLNSSDLPAPLENLDMHVIMKGKKADVDKFEMKMGQSDLSLKGYLSDLPAVVHHTNIPVTAHLEIASNVIDIAEITKHNGKDSKGIDERIEDLSVGFSFVSSAKSFTESKYLPVGEFFIDSLHAQLKHYPHELHDFHADVLIEEHDLKIVDFTGYIDKSDFHFNGLVHDYEFWMQPELNGDVDLDITLHSDLLKLEDVFSYNGDNYVPEDYRHEEFDNLELHVNSSMHYKKSHLHSVDIDLDKLTTKMHVHPMRFKNFKGRFHFEEEHLMIEKFHGQMGRTLFNIDMNYYLGNDQKIKKRDNYFGLKANYVDLDELTNFSLEQPKKEGEKPKVEKSTADVSEHAEAFNIYDLPFTDMKFDVDIAHFINNRIDLKNVHARLRTTKNHYLYIDTLRMNMAGGSVAMSGYFNGSDPKHIYMKPNLNLKNCDIDKLLFKFENFGQEALVSENLHGKLTAKIDGKIRVYPDMVPDLDQSEIHMDIQILNGRLVNYKPMLLLSDYFGDKNLNDLRFDTLENHIDITNGLLTIPNMTIESTLGHMEFSGTQSMGDQIEYYIRIPWKMIRQASKQKLFGNKKTADGEIGDDEIIEVDPNEKTRYLNLKMIGTLDDYKIRPGKARKKNSKKKSNS